MRIVIILAVLCFLGWAGFSAFQKFTGGGFAETAVESVSQIDKETVEDSKTEDELRRENEAIMARVEQAEKLVEAARADGEKRETELNQQLEKLKEKPDTGEFVVYQFRNRQLPPTEQLTELIGNSALLDERTNSIVVRADSPEEMAKLSAVFAFLDKKSTREQYRIEGVIVNAEIASGDEFSIDWLVKVASPFEQFKRADIFLSPGSAIAETTWFDLSIEKAQTLGSLEVLARPSLILAEGETATISSGREVPIPVTNVQDGNAQTSVEFRQVALELQVGLREVGDNLAVTINQINADIAGESDLGGFSVPVVASQNWNTQIVPEFGTWYAIGGVISERAEDIETKGFLFTNRKIKSFERREIGLFIRVVNVAGVDDSQIPRGATAPALRAIPIDEPSAYARPLTK